MRNPRTRETRIHTIRLGNSVIVRRRPSDSETAKLVHIQKRHDEPTADTTTKEKPIK